MRDFENNMILDTSIPLPNGGDTHIHPWGSGTGFTVTTRVRGLQDGFHENFRFSRLEHTPADASGLKFLK